MCTPAAGLSWAGSLSATPCEMLEIGRGGVVRLPMLVHRGKIEVFCGGLVARLSKPWVAEGLR